MTIKPDNPIINWNYRITKGLIFNTPMSEKGGIVAKDIVGKKKGMVFFDGATKVVFTKTLFGQAMDLDGSDWAVPSPVLSYTRLGTKFTIAQWVKMPSLASVYAFTTFDNAIMINVSASDWRWQQDEGAFTNIGCTITRLANVWYLYVVTKEGTGAGQTKLYLNGVQSDNGAAVDDPTSGDLTIGRQPGGSPRSLVGQTIGPMIWNRALDKREVRQLYSNPWKIYRNPLRPALNTGIV